MTTCQPQQQSTHDTAHHVLQQVFRASKLDHAPRDAAADCCPCLSKRLASESRGRLLPAWQGVCAAACTPCCWAEPCEGDWWQPV